MMPYFYPKELDEYRRHFPYVLRIAYSFLPYDKKEDEAYVALLCQAMQRGKPLTKEELVAYFGKVYYMQRRYPEHYGQLSRKEEITANIFYKFRQNMKQKPIRIFDIYRNAILAYVRGVQGQDALTDYTEDYMHAAPYFQWSEIDMQIALYLVPSIYVGKRWPYSYDADAGKMLQKYFKWVKENMKPINFITNETGEKMLPQEVKEVVRSYFDKSQSDLIYAYERVWCNSSYEGATIAFLSDVLAESVRELSDYINRNADIFQEYNPEEPEAFLADVSLFLDEVEEYSMQIADINACLRLNEHERISDESYVLLRLLAQQAFSEVLLFLNKLSLSLTSSGYHHIMLNFDADLLMRLAKKNNSDGKNGLLALAGAFGLGYLFGVE